jgi:hypothetical protein
MEESPFGVNGGKPLGVVPIGAGKRREVKRRWEVEEGKPQMMRTG